MYFKRPEYAASTPGTLNSNLTVVMRNCSVLGLESWADHRCTIFLSSRGKELFYTLSTHRLYNQQTSYYSSKPVSYSVRVFFAAFRYE